MANIDKISGYYSTLGGANDYASASTNVAARVIFPGGDIGTFTVLMWVKQDTANGFNFWSCGTFGGDYLYNVAAGRGEQDVEARDGGAGAGSVYALLPDTEAWALYVVTCDGSTLRGYGDGVESVSSAVSGTYGAQDVFVLFSSTADNTLLGIASGETGSLCNAAIFNRALTADEIGALYVAGEEHDIRTPSEGWAGEVPYVYWCEAPINGRVMNFGYGGSCDLILNGNVSVGAFQPDYEEFPLPYPAKILEALTFLFGKESQHIGGVPVTHLLANYTAGDPYFYVKSTLGFPNSGTVRVNNRKFTYTSRTPQTFDGISGDWVYYNLPKGAYVVSVTADTAPADSVDGVPHVYEPGA